MQQRRIAYLGLGSNLGDRARFLAQARERLAALPDTTLARASRVYETAPQEITDQPAFLNQVVELRTALSPRTLLGYLKEIEAALGRRPGPRGGPREVDIDILLMEGVAVEEPGLVVPHPHLAERAFVLAPLAELAPQLRLPGGETVLVRARKLQESQAVAPVDL